MRFFLLAAGAFCIAYSCRQTIPRNDSSVWKKIHLDFRQIDNDGLSGPPNGKVAVHYEFCIPNSEKYWKQVHKIDTTARLMKGSRGRIGCSDNQWLVVGHTHRPEYRLVLYDLAFQPWIGQIEQVYWE